MSSSKIKESATNFVISLYMSKVSNVLFMIYHVNRYIDIILTFSYSWQEEKRVVEIYGTL